MKNFEKYLFYSTLINKCQILAVCRFVSLNFSSYKTILALRTLRQKIDSKACKIGKQFPIHDDFSKESYILFRNASIFE
jgi:hypothetical protein